MSEVEKTPVTMEELNTILAAHTANLTKQLGMDKVDRRHGVFPTNSPEEIKAMSKDERIKHFIRGVYKKDEKIINAIQDSFGMEQHAYTEGTTTAGGYLVPDEFQTEVIRVAAEFGVARKEGNVFGFGGDTLYLNAENAVPTVAWTDEAAQITESTGSFTQPSISIKKLAAISAMSNELFADSKVNLIQLIATQVGEALAEKEDLAAFAGDGTSTYGSVTGLTGLTLTSTTQTISGTSLDNLSADDLLDVQYKVAAKWRKGAIFVMHPNVFARVRKLKDANGAYVVTNPPSADQFPTIWGRRVVESEAMPSTDASGTKFIGFVNVKRHLYFADRSAMELSIGREGTVGSNNLFEKDMSAVRITERLGMVWVLGTSAASIIATGS